MKPLKLTIKVNLDAEDQTRRAAALEVLGRQGLPTQVPNVADSYIYRVGLDTCARAVQRQAKQAVPQ